MSKLKRGAATFSLLLVILGGALAAYSECDKTAHHLEFSVEHEDALVHCPDALLHSNIQATSTIQPHSRNLSKIPPSIDEKLDSVVLVARFNDHPFREPISQQDLFRFEEIYRL